MTLPEPSQIEVERRLAVEPRHAATPRRSRCRRALERLVGVVRARACRPSTCRPPSPRRLKCASRVVVGVVVGARQAHRQRGRRLGLDAPGRRARCPSAAGRPARLPKALRCAACHVACATAGAHPRGGAEHAVQARVVDHLDDRRDAAARLADHPRPRAVELDLARGVGAVAELVLEALDAGTRCACRRAGRAAARSRTTPSSVCARTRKRSHIGAEQNHLWPTSSYSAPAPPPFSGVADGRVGAHVRAALLLGHRHAAQCAEPSRPPGRSSRVVGRRRSAAAPTRRRARAASAAPGPPRRSS